MLIYKGKRKDVKTAVSIANTLMENGVVEDIISEVDDFEYTDVKTSEIIKHFTLYKYVDEYVFVKCMWRPKYWKTNAVHNKKGITLNSRKIADMPSLVARLIHEMVHEVDSHTSDNFGHGNNSSVNKEMSVPYYVGNRIKEIVDQEYKDLYNY